MGNKCTVCKMAICGSMAFKKHMEECTSKKPEPKAPRQPTQEEVTAAAYALAAMACAAPVDTSSAPVTVTDRQNKSDAAPGPQNLSLTGPQTASRDTNKAALPERPATSSKQKLFAASTSPPQKETVHGPLKKDYLYCWSTKINSF